MTHPQGTFVWSDVALRNVDAGIAFYTAVFGWEVAAVDAPGGGAGYWMFKKDGATIAGMAAIGDEMAAQGMQPMWSAYIGVDDVDPIAVSAAELGAIVLVPPMDINDAGRMVYIRDPQGAAVGFWQAGAHVGADTFDTPGAVTWNELATRDADASKAFYSALIGWGIADQDFDGFPYSIVQVGDIGIGGIFTMDDSYPTDVVPHWITYFAVADTDSVAAAINGAGGSVLVGPMDTPFGRMAAVVDNQGAMFRIIESGQDE